MHSHRSHEEIIFQILECLYTNNAMLVTRLGQATNQSFSSTIRDLRALIKVKLIFIEEVNNAKLYRLTSKGREYYQTLQEAKKYLTEVE